MFYIVNKDLDTCVVLDDFDYTRELHKLSVVEKLSDFLNIIENLNFDTTQDYIGVSAFNKLKDLPDNSVFIINGKSAKKICSFHSGLTKDGIKLVVRVEFDNRLYNYSENYMRIENVKITV